MSGTIEGSQQNSRARLFSVINVLIPEVRLAWLWGQKYSRVFLPIFWAERDIVAGNPLILAETQPAFLRRALFPPAQES